MGYRKQQTSDLKFNFNISAIKNVSNIQEFSRSYGSYEGSHSDSYYEGTFLHSFRVNKCDNVRLNSQPLKTTQQTDL